MRHNYTEQPFYIQRNFHWLKQMVFTFAFLGLLTGCEQSVVSEPAPALPSTAPEIQATPTPEPEATVPVAPGRCDEKGFLTTSQPLEVEVIENASGFTRKQNVKGYDTHNYICHNPLTDTLLITNGTEVLEFNPRTQNITRRIDTALTGFSHEKEQGFQFQSLKSCAVNTKGEIYLAEGNQVYFVEPDSKRIKTIKYLNIEDNTLTDRFIGLVNFTETNGNFFISDMGGLYRVQGTDLQLIFRAFQGLDLQNKGSFPTKVDPTTKWPIDVVLTTIGAIAADDNNALYFTSSHQHGFFKLTLSEDLYLIDPQGISRLEHPKRDNYPLGSTLNLIYHPMHHVFLGEGGALVTRDGCLGNILPDSNEAQGPTYRNVAITNDGSIYGVSFKQLEILKFTVPPGLPEAAQWEPPQAWKDATGLD